MPIQLMNLRLRKAEVDYLPPSLSEHPQLHIYTHNPNDEANHGTFDPTAIRHIHLQHTGYLAPDSPAVGLSVCWLEVGVVYVGFCQETKRSTLTHVFDMNQARASFEDQLKFLRGDVPVSGVSTVPGDKKTGAKLVELAIFTGANSSTPPGTLESPRSNEFNTALSDYAKTLDIRLKFTLYERGSPFDCLILQRGTGIVQLPRLPGSFRRTPATIQLLVASAVSHAAETRRWRTQLETMTLGVLKHQSSPIWIQYDGYKELPLPTLSESPRTLQLRHQNGASQTELYTLAASLARANGFTVTRRAIEEGLSMYLDKLKENGLACELCGVASLGDKMLTSGCRNSVGGVCKDEACIQVECQRCSGCKTVAYCGREHQVLDWQNHKEWCKKHAVEKKQIK